MRILQCVARPFLGSGIAGRYPVVKRIYGSLYRLGREREVRVEIPLGATLAFSSHDLGVGFILLTTGAYEPFETRLFLDEVREGDTVFDVGANIGFHTVLAAKKAGGAGRVVAFEPEPRNVARLRQNLALNGLDNVTVVEKAVSDRPGVAHLQLSPLDSGMHSIVRRTGPPRAGAREVECVTLDGWCRENQLYPDVLKLDIESAEGRLLRGAGSLLDRAALRTLFMEFYPLGLEAAGTPVNEVLHSLQSRGFRLEVLEEGSGTRAPYSDAVRARLEEHGTYTNLLVTRPPGSSV